jgi:capsular exopolysaccharide synthesis family protein
MKDVESEFGPSLLGNIPRIKKKEFNKLGQEKGVFAESILSLRTSLIFHLEDSKMKVISVSSPQERDGKTIITANLALGLAHTGKKVLIIDANLRNPTLHTIFDIPPTAPGLTDAVLNNTKLADYVKRTSHKNLFYLPTGELHNSPIEIVSSEGMKTLFTKLKTTAFDVILIDNSSLEYSESSIICAQSEGTILIIAHEKTEKTQLKKAKDLLRKAKAKIIGIVINFSR